MFVFMRCRMNVHIMEKEALSYFLHLMREAVALDNGQVSSRRSVMTQ